MLRHILPIAAIGLPAIGLTMITVPAHAAEIQIAAEGPVVELSVEESVATDPDIATVSAGVSTIAPSAVEALQTNSVEMNKVIDRIESLGIADDDIQTTGISLNPEYDYDQAEGRQIFRGYRVSNRVTVKLREIDRTGRVLDALVEAGATDLGGISWSVEDPAPAREQARQAAFASAQERAMEYARMAGYADLRLLEVSESITGNRPIAFDQAESSRAGGDSAPVRPGQTQIGVNLTVKYEMTR